MSSKTDAPHIKRLSDTFHRRLGVFAALSALACTAAVGSLAYWSAEQVLQDSLRAQALAAADQLAIHASDEIKSLAEHSRYYVSTDQRRAFEADGDLLALSVLHKPTDDSADWAPRLRWTLPESNPDRVAAADFAEIDLKHPIDYDRIAQGASDVIFARSGSSSGFLRLAIPYGEKTATGFSEAIVAEVKMSKFQALFTHREGVFTFMTAARGELVIANDSGHFGPGENIAQLGVVQAAQDSARAQGSLDYDEPPRGETQYSAFARVAAVPGLAVIAQAPHSRISMELESLIVGLAAAGLSFAFLIGLTTWWFGSRWSWQLSLRDGQPTLRDAAPVAPAGDSASAATTHATSAAPATQQSIAKIQNPEIRQAFEKGQVKLSGERIEAAVLHAHLHGVDRLSSEADPERLLALLNEFHQKAVHAIESRRGVVDHIHGGSIVAFWGVPRPKKEDVAQAIEAASEVSEAADMLNQTLKKEGLKICRLGMGLHYGALAVGQVGSAGRLEYSAIGEALEVAGRIQQFTEQFGTDFILTAAAAKRAGPSFATEQLTAGDDETPELHEIADAEAGQEDAA